ncbi:thiamine pyrophosphate-binding protein [Pseudarthrobacter sp. J75]|uniref:thiamine pyrophosphate-binding protein n=1 Tax=unclassified Pseudarthrobacter TaxID=2647000 RepID=UPI002E81CBE6|nr:MULTISPECIES: thiamine pyrophosphate-binding protein [unclassified Pseudarthrobacter]MEE2522447.1 thiamine pyrophosphate-binding protein [Pseudarthrobacter sp. J47]MEE2529222.1 thiamine pyrophosphate-binding protein [Pseudarthrobacter sp. J75]
MTTVSTRIAEVLVDHVEEVFALMGNGNAYFVDALSRSPLRVVALRHEAAAVASADAYHRITRKLAVATTTYGPGYTNTITSLIEAAQSRTPLLVVVGDAPTTGLRPWDVDQSAMAAIAGVRTFTATVDTPGATTLEAIHWALAERRPAVLAIPYDVASADTAEVLTSTALPPLPAPPAAPIEDLKRVADLLANAQRPLVLAGRGAREAAESLGSLADAVGALTVASAPAHGIFAGRSYDLGVCGGFASEASARLIRQADVIFAVGASLNQFTTSFGHAFDPEATVVQVNLINGPTNPRVDLSLMSDARVAATALLDMVPHHDGPRWAGQAEEAAGSRTHLDREEGEEFGPDGRLDPRPLMRRLNTILPANRQLVSDGGHFIGWANTYLDLPRPDSITLVGTIFQSIGLGLPSATGAAIARPDDTIVVVVGDGGGLMGLPDLDSLIRAANSAIVLVFNDAAYGAEVHQYGSQGLSQAIMQIDQVDFATVARGFGASSAVINTLEDLTELEAWIGKGAQGTFVADLRISQKVIAPYIQEIIELTLKK